MLKMALGICGFVLVESVMADITPNIDAGRQKSAVCAACHNADGNSIVPAWPKIAGLPLRYFIEQMVDIFIKTDYNRLIPAMFGIVQSMTDQDFTD
jgi:cytochrome c553